MGLEALQQLGRQSLSHHLRVAGLRTDRVDPDPIAAQLEGGDLGQPPDREFARRVSTGQRGHKTSVDRRDIYDRATSPTAHHVDHGSDPEERSERIDPHDALE
jgi:hypothetical protein